MPCDYMSYRQAGVFWHPSSSTPSLQACPCEACPGSPVASWSRACMLEDNQRSNASVPVPVDEALWCQCADKAQCQQLTETDNIRPACSWAALPSLGSQCWINKEGRLWDASACHSALTGSAVNYCPVKDSYNYPWVRAFIVPRRCTAWSLC